MALFELKGVSRHYHMGGETVRALDNVDLEIDRDEFLAILGPSGSGKSTLMHLLGFMDSPTGGSLRFDGVEAGRLKEPRRAWYRSHSLGFVFQSFNLLPRLSVLDNVLLPCIYRHERIPNRRERARQALERVGMGHRLRNRPAQLSGGERQRVSIARALINRPKLILADEPTGALDTANVGRVLDLLGELACEGMTIVMVTHDLEVAGHARRIVYMRDGKIQREERR